ncbi:hypothetical protein Clacol_008571 [Clathrus columnatus]|uniref:Cytochrome P450 n=1 Tax=Clathrus columnatus TaxID=1419009 RepID=A0AAV5AKW2_9AGAM|nr:hypothetical protein Clacol_008571 [Clathrus columnatus]
MSDSLPLPATVLISAGIAASVIVYRLLKSPNAKFPGPRPVPVIGNAHQMPQEHPWLTFSQWQKVYGDVIYLEAFGKPILVVNSSDIAIELLDKRSATYSDRPHLIMASDLCGFGRTFVMQPYGEDWRNQRKAITQNFSPGTIPIYFPVQERQAAVLVQNILNSPDKLDEEVKFQVATVIVRVTFGHYLTDENDPCFSLPMEVMSNFSAATLPGNFMVDFFPALRHLPRWMPGAGFLKTAEKWNKTQYDASWIGYNWSEEHMATGETYLPSLVGSALHEIEGNVPPDVKHNLVWGTSSVLGGGMDTNMSTIMTFFYAMILHPDIQRKAQAEIDALLGNQRLPVLTDRSSLPYLRALVTELYRWRTNVPLGVAHSLNKDDVYNGIVIKKGTIIMPNVWHMLHDPNVYPDPLTYNPDRYKGSDAEMKKVTDLAFGFGRRTCPGYNFAQGTIFSIIMTTLATCNILPPVDVNGKEYIPNVEYSSGMISVPSHFNIQLKSRSLKAQELLHDALSKERI